MLKLKKQVVFNFLTSHNIIFKENSIRFYRVKHNTYKFYSKGTKILQWRIRTK